ncbi:MAG: hypothetical protein JOS17DRAFT_516923 [Linnemannia elongata]|nr:MAG: hypothetical protein JOS17DRAFT_516923 [Linnemannia elongata]
MAKQDAIIDRPLRAEKESATNGVCKDKQLKPRQDAVDVASLAISETPPSGRQDSSPRLSHRPSPQQQQQRQQQQQPQPLHPRPASGSPPIQSLLVLQEQHPLKNTTANRTRTSSPAGLGREGEGGATVDKPLDDPLPSNSTTALAADLDPTSAQTLDNSDDTEANVGLARWHLCRSNPFDLTAPLFFFSFFSSISPFPSPVLGHSTSQEWNHWQCNRHH